MRPQHITAENEGLPGPSSDYLVSFNEAAAYHCGKPGRTSPRRGYPVASMRPQHITAENLHPPIPLRQQLGCFNEAAAYHCGKREQDRATRDGPGAASMRPQHITAENPCTGRRRKSIAVASMRPQHITAENATIHVGPLRGAGRFNEAAAYHCGKRGMHVHASPAERRASMRPQHITAENARSPAKDARRTRWLQ